MIQLKNISKRYYDTLILDKLTLSIDSGEFLYLIGESGAGKSTLLKLLTGEVFPSEGLLTVNGFNLAESTDQELINYRRELGIVFQDFKLLANKTVFENIAYRLEIQGLPAAFIKSEVARVLELVDLKGVARSFPTKLSGGEQQRVAIARAMIVKPKLLIADEPTANLDPKTSLKIMEAFSASNRLGTTVIMATHNAEIVTQLPKRLIEMKAGRIIRDQRNGSYRALERSLT